MKKILLLSAIWIFCPIISGCAMFAPIAPIVQLGIMWYEGEAQKYYATPQEGIDVALTTVLNDLKIPITKREVKDNVIYVSAGDDNKFKIKIVSVRENVTKLAIRVNIMGDKPYAEMIFRHVDSQPKVQQFASVKEINEAMNKQKRRFLLR